MTTMNQYCEKFQRLLRELFQFDCADLDFGIYRIMNHKRGVIKRFISTDLPRAIAEELDRGALADQSQAAAELKEVAAQIRETLGADALDADGRLAETYHATPLGKKYLSLKAKAAGGRGREALEAAIFNHLYAFFSRYYQDGDFISKRRYSKRERYAIPYNGEEVYLYWANHDQYYVKTAEYFHDYAWKARNGVAVHFTLMQADVEQNNVKGDKRFFLPRYRECRVMNDECGKGGKVVIPFEYRPLTEQEDIAYGKKNQQDAIIAEALTEIPKRLSPRTAWLALAALTAEKRKDSEGRSVSFLEHHLRQYTRRNTSDFFIHKDLKGFLSRELDFYLKNEVLNLDEMEAAGEERAEGWFQMMRVIKAVGGRIIDFLHQIEEFQKTLWEKRKFITETQYCITVGNIDESFYGDIAACDAQWAEWKELFHIDEEAGDLFTSGKSRKDRRVAFLKAHPTLVLDTRHFDRDFVDRLLGSFDDLDGLTDGLLIHSENFQALGLLVEKYRQRIRCIYIDPPFNSDDSQFAFKDTYRNSTWLSLMSDRLRVGSRFLTLDGTIYLHLDHNSNYYGRFLLDHVFGKDALLNEVVWRIGWVSGYKTSAERYVRNHETIFVYGRQEQPYFDKDKARISYKAFDESTISAQIEAIKQAWGLAGLSSVRLKLIFKDGNDNVYKTGLAEKEGAYNIEDTWNCNEYEDLHSNKIKRNAAEYTPRGSEITQKPEQLLRRVIEVSSQEGDIVLDYFAGSGTTPAVAKKTKRRFVAVEMGSYFDTDMLWRMKQVLFGRQVGVSRQTGYQGGGMFKYIRLESYEDALNNIEFDEASGQRLLQFKDYLLKYMLQWETKQSATLLNVEKLARPFSYKLLIHSDGQTREKVADVPETFNYLLGLEVQTRKVYWNDECGMMNDEGKGGRYLVYRGKTRDNRTVVVIWRDTEGWTKADLERDKKFVAEQKLTEGADEVFVNGDSFIPDARALEPVFKARMFASVE